MRSVFVDGKISNEGGAPMTRNSENLLFQTVPDGLIKRQEVRTIYVQHGIVTEERVERVFFDEDLEEYFDARSSIPLVK